MPVNFKSPVEKNAFEQKFEQLRCIISNGLFVLGSISCYLLVILMDFEIDRFIVNFSKHHSGTIERKIT